MNFASMLQGKTDNYGNLYQLLGFQHQKHKLKPIIKKKKFQNLQ